MVRLDLPYLWAANGRRRQYWFYRRNGLRVPISLTDGRRLSQGEPGFLEAYERIHASFEVAPEAGPNTGTLAHLVEEYRASPEFTGLGERTKKDYGRHLDTIKRKHGHRSVALMPRDAVFKLRDEYRDTPRTANYLIQVLRLILSYAEDRKQTFRLPHFWTNPARRPKKLKTGDGFRPWEEIEIDEFRKKWAIGTFERALFETFLNTGQRGGDIAHMVRRQYYNGRIHVAQEKTKERVWIPASRDLRAALDPWLQAHKHLVLFPTPERGRPLTPDHMRHVMRDAMRDIGLSDECTLHGLRYTFATRAIELGLSWQAIESIVGHRTAQMASKYTEKVRLSQLTVLTLDRGTKAEQPSGEVKTAADRD